MNADRLRTDIRRMAVEWQEREKEHAADCLRYSRSGEIGDKARAVGADHARSFCGGIVEGLRLTMTAMGDCDGLRLLQSEREAA